MSRFDKNTPRNDSDKQDQRISRLFESFPQVGHTVICDNCHVDYVVRATNTDSPDQQPDCPYCAHRPPRYSLTRVRLEKVKTKLGWKTTSDRARKWWNEIESRNARRLERVLNLAWLLHSKSATIDEFYESYLQSDARKVAATLSFMDFLRAKQAELAVVPENEGVPAISRLPKTVLMRISTEAGHGVAVVLLSYRGRKLWVIRAILQLTELSLRETKCLVESAPDIIGYCATVADATIVVNRINSAGGIAHVGEYE